VISSIAPERSAALPLDVHTSHLLREKKVLKIREAGKE
jgi:hypothetical protein